MDNPLQTLYSWLSGVGQQSPTQPNQATQPAQRQPVSLANPSQQSGLSQLLSSPLVQGGLASYLAYLSRPRGLNTNAWQGVGIGGLTGLEAMQQARQQQLALPMQQAQLAREQAQTTQAQQQTKLGQRQLAPVTPGAIQAIHQWRQKLQADPNTQPQELAQANTLESQARAGVISNEDVDTALRNFAAEKAQAEMLKANMGWQMMSAFAPMLAPLGIHVPTAPNTGTPPMAPGASPTAASAGGAITQITLPDGRVVPSRTWKDLKTGEPKTFYFEDGKWTPAPSTTP